MQPCWAERLLFKRLENITDAIWSVRIYAIHACIRKHNVITRLRRFCDFSATTTTPSSSHQTCGAKNPYCRCCNEFCVVLWHFTMLPHCAMSAAISAQLYLIASRQCSLQFILSSLILQPNNFVCRTFWATLEASVYLWFLIRTCWTLKLF